MFRRLILVSSVSVLFLSQDGVADESVLDNANVFVQLALHTENEVLKGIRWEWTMVKGKSQSISDALLHKFDVNYPIDKYKCRWLVNDGKYMCESIAQQDRRIIERDNSRQILLTTTGSAIALNTKKTRLQYDPKPFSTWNGIVQNEQNGLSDSWAPTTIPLYGGEISLGSIGHILDGLEVSKNKITLEDSVTEVGIHSKLLRISRNNDSEKVYHFGDSNLNLLQSDSYFKKRLISRMVVLKTQKFSISDSEIELPMESVSFYKNPGEKNWNVTYLSTNNIKLEQVPLSEMVYPMKGAIFGLFPMGHREKLDFVNEVSVENLDNVVETLYANLEKRRIAFLEMNKKKIIANKPNTMFKYLILFNSAILLTGILFYIYRLWVKSHSS